MKPETVMARLCWLYGRSVEYISRLLDWSPHIVARVLRPVWRLAGVAR